MIDEPFSSGAYGLLAALSLLLQRDDLLPSIEQGKAMVRDCIALGGVEGYDGLLLYYDHE